MSFPWKLVNIIYLFFGESDARPHSAGLWEPCFREALCTSKASLTCSRDLSSIIKESEIFHKCWLATVPALESHKGSGHFVSEVAQLRAISKWNTMHQLFYCCFCMPDLTCLSCFVAMTAPETEEEFALSVTHLYPFHPRCSGSHLECEEHCSCSYSARCLCSHPWSGRSRWKSTNRETTDY